jgi:hypothetical protein
MNPHGLIMENDHDDVKKYMVRLTRPVASNRNRYEIIIVASRKNLYEIGLRCQVDAVAMKTAL